MITNGTTEAVNRIKKDTRWVWALLLAVVIAAGMILAMFFLGGLKGGASGSLPSAGSITANPSFMTTANYHSGSGGITPLATTYEVTIDRETNGTVTYSGSVAPATVTVNESDTPSFSITPNPGYTFSVSVGGTPVAAYQKVSGDSGATTYTMAPVTADTVISISFDIVPEKDSTFDEKTGFLPDKTGLTQDYYELKFSKPYVRMDDTDVNEIVFFLPNDATTATLKARGEYDGVRYNDRNYSDEYVFNSTTKIDKAQPFAVAKSRLPGFTGWYDDLKVKLPRSIHVVIDTTSPTISNLSVTRDPGRFAATITGRVADTDTSANPSSGISKVVWSKSGTLSPAQVRAETTNAVIVSGSNWDFTVYGAHDDVRYYVYSVDFAGNVSSAQQVRVDMMVAEPVITGFTFKKTASSDPTQVINFMDIGTFSNDTIEVVVSAEDARGSSSLSKITLYRDVEVYEVKDSADFTTFTGKSASATFTLKLADFETGGVISAVAENSGSITGSSTEPTQVRTNAKSNNVYLKNEIPIIEITAPSPVYTNGTKEWYAGNVEFKIEADTGSGGLSSVTIDVNGKKIVSDNPGTMLPKIFWVNTEEKPQEGENIIEVTAVNYYGNEVTERKSVYIDTANPEVTSYHFSPSTSDEIDEVKAEDFMTALEYGLYFKSDFTVDVSVSDPGVSSGLKKIEYRLVYYEKDGKTVEVIEEQDIVEGTASIRVPEGFKGQIFVQAFDHTRKVSEEVTSQGFVSDGVKPKISITNNNPTDHHDAYGNKLYVADMSFIAVISDPSSGIREIGYMQSSENGSFERKTITVDNSGFENRRYSIEDDLGDGWIVSAMDNNLVTEVKKEFAYTADDNDIVLTLDATDRSGNKEEEVKSEKITVDKTAPVINIVFRNDEPHNQYYYNSARIADITVIERNFDASLIKAAIENTFGGVPEVSFTEASNKEHTAVISFGEGDYTFSMSGTDLGDQAATVNYSGGNEQLFYVDTTAPSIVDNFDEFTYAVTEDSFNTDKEVTITVTERNFDPELIKLRILSKDAGADHNSADLADATAEFGGAADWVTTENVHTTTFTILADAVYQIEITPEDLAGNTSDYRSTVIFEIDKTVPIIGARNDSYVDPDETEFLDIYGYDRKDDPAPSVDFIDSNIDHIQYSLTVWVPDYSSSEELPLIRPVKIFLEDDSSESGIIPGGRFTVPDFAQDGAYSLTLVAVDVAGNESVLNTNTYARMIDRDVLAFILNSNVKNKTGLYSFQYEDGTPISMRPDNFSDLEIFVATKKGTSVDIVLRDTNADELYANAQVITNESVYGLSIRNFTLTSDFFKDNYGGDTDIDLHLTVKNDNNRIDLGKMHIDNVAPTCELPDTLSSWHWYFGEEARTVTLTNISELLDEDACKVYDNGQEIVPVYSSENNTLTFTLEKGWHSVGVVLSDMAGNTYNVQEKINMHVGYFWLWIIIASVLVVIGTAALIFTLRRKRKQGLETE